MGAADLEATYLSNNTKAASHAMIGKSTPGKTNNTRNSFICCCPSITVVGQPRTFNFSPQSGLKCSSAGVIWMCRAFTRSSSCQCSDHRATITIPQPPACMQDSWVQFLATADFSLLLCLHFLAVRVQNLLFKNISHMLLVAC